jgi:hypothetical protein
MLYTTCIDWLNLFGKCRNDFHKKIKETFKNLKIKTKVSHDFNTKIAYISDLRYFLGVYVLFGSL